jgi:hypothetical protein
LRAAETDTCGAAAGADVATGDMAATVSELPGVDPAGAEKEPRRDEAADETKTPPSGVTIGVPTVGAEPEPERDRLAAAPTRDTPRTPAEKEPRREPGRELTAVTGSGSPQAQNAASCPTAPQTTQVFPVEATDVEGEIEVSAEAPISTGAPVSDATVAGAAAGAAVGSTTADATATATAAAGGGLGRMWSGTQISALEDDGSGSGGASSPHSSSDTSFSAIVDVAADAAGT